MDSITAAAERRRAHVRVGVAATAAFVLLVLLFSRGGPARAGEATPAATPSAPQSADPGYARPRGGFGRRDRGASPYGGGGFDQGGNVDPDDGGGFDPGGSVPSLPDPGSGGVPSIPDPGSGATPSSPSPQGGTRS
ncbi:MAG TPA: hypothetical protein VNS09_04005 [Solirubrobacter sp.]|nr:hypothetical protein [Solirubrobacter sp.]